MSPRKQLLLALIIGPFIGWGLATVLDRPDKPKPPAPYTYTPAPKIQKQYVTGYIGKEYVKLEIVKK